ncbi:MAG: DUF86 domain-containing protein [bacterium]|nr:DUF86 domain-containing protein [bacterium]
MDIHITERKLDHMRSFVQNLREYTEVPVEEFHDATIAARAAEREFQLFVDNAIDINTMLIRDSGKPIPDTYYKTFIELGTIGVLAHDTATQLANCARMRNILVHEYDIEVDVSKFYRSVHKFIPLFEHYLQTIFKLIQASS